MHAAPTPPAGAPASHASADAAAAEPIAPTQCVRELDGSLTEYYDIPLRPGSGVLRPHKVLRLAQMEGHGPQELGTLLALCRDLFAGAWRSIRFGIELQGAVYELQLGAPPEPFALLDGYLTVGLPPGPAHFHLCIAPTRGLGRRATPEPAARIRPCARAAFYRSLRGEGCTPGSWGLRLWNGAGEQQLTVFLPSPFLGDELQRIEPDPARLALWNELRARYLGERCPQPPPAAPPRAAHA
jgi:hypothetical protein